MYINNSNYFSETRIQRLDQQIFSANMEGHQGHSVRLQTQKSVVTGMKKVYNKLKTKKWQEIQELSSLILQTQDHYQPQPEDIPTPAIPAETDTMATSITEFYCSYSRTA